MFKRRITADEYPVMTDRTLGIIKELNTEIPGEVYYELPPPGTDSVTLKRTPHTATDRTNYNRKKPKK